MPWWDGKQKIREYLRDVNREKKVRYLDRRKSRSNIPVGS